jgi:hypothetical protein
MFETIHNVFITIEKHIIKGVPALSVRLGDQLTRSLTMLMCLSMIYGTGDWTRTSTFFNGRF